MRRAAPSPLRRHDMCAAGAGHGLRGGHVRDGAVSALSRRRHGDKRWRHTPHAIIRYRLHNDWFRPEEPGYADKMLGGGQRRISIFIYLQQTGNRQQRQNRNIVALTPHLSTRSPALLPPEEPLPPPSPPKPRRRLAACPPVPAAAVFCTIKLRCGLWGGRVSGQPVARCRLPCQVY